MKSLEELTLTTSITQLLPRVILAEVEEAARAARFGRNLVQINTDLVRTKGRSIVIGRRGTLSASSVDEGVDLSGSSQNLAYTASTLTPAKIGVPVYITQEAIDGANLDLIRDNILEAGLALADKEDTDIIYALTGATTFSCIMRGTVTQGAVGGTFWTASKPILYIPSSATVTVCGTTGFAILGVDYYDGKITTTGVVGAAVGATLVPATSYYSANTYYSDSIGMGTLTYEDIVAGLGKVRAQKWTPDFLLIHPNQVNDLLKNSAFRDASQYGNADTLLKGEIGMISGVKVLVSTNMFEGSALYLCSKRAAWMAIKRNVDMKRWDNPRSDSIELYFYMEYQAKVTDQTAVCISVNHMASAPVATSI